ncbi:MAG: GNAT family N-acetyltransferase [Acidimicrobiaceae bacterium]|nr:GNAT family N-acetyltransferase [Acidimicrobiaceae bacterium]
MNEQGSGVKLGPFGDGALDKLEEFLAEISGELALRRGGTQLLGELGHPTELARKIANAGENSFVFAMTLNNALSGLIWAEIILNEFGERVCYVPVFAVLNDARRHGVGANLFSALEEWVASRDATAIEFTTLPGDRHTKNFCEANGLIARSLKMYKPIKSS